MPTSDILTKLAELDESPWGDLYGEGLKPRKLAQLLSDYGIKSQDVWTAFGSRKGYRREDLWDSWQRYTPPEKRDVGDVGDENLADIADLADSQGTKADDPVETDGALFDSSPNDDEVRYCACGNKLLTIDAINSGRCRPCRNKAMAG